MRMSARHVPAYAEKWAGDFHWVVGRRSEPYAIQVVTGLRAQCPCGCRGEFRLDFSVCGPNPVTPYHFNDDLDRPSVSGPIKLACGWTGYLRDGFWSGEVMQEVA